jgi:monofunctional biosynthetic peptidoglycan transglycosylase
MGRVRNLMRNRWLRRVLAAVAVVVLLPYLLTLVYAVVPPPVSATMLWKKLDGQGIDYRWRPLADTSQNLVRSVVTAEDAGICRHNGVEWGVLGEVISEAMQREGGPTRGGSTITQQVAKNLFLWPSRSYVRKALEIPLALWIDLVWTKRRIVEVYVNTAEWAPGVYGQKLPRNTTSTSPPRHSPVHRRHGWRPHCPTRWCAMPAGPARKRAQRLVPSGAGSIPQCPIWTA